MKPFWTYSHYCETNTLCHYFAIHVVHHLHLGYAWLILHVTLYMWGWNVDSWQYSYWSEKRIRKNCSNILYMVHKGTMMLYSHDAVCPGESWDVACAYSCLWTLWLASQPWLYILPIDLCSLNSIDAWSITIWP
jgi:hypothetical protein